jgi:hypothetical protein
MSTKHANVYQVVVKAVPLDRAEPAVALSAPPFSYVQVAQPAAMPLKAQLGQYMSPELKAGIRKVLGVVGVKV